MQTSNWRVASAFAAQIYSAKLANRYAAYVQRAPLARAGLAPWNRNPYPLYDQVRAGGPVVAGRTPGVWLSADHGACGQVLRSRSFGVVEESDAANADGFDALSTDDADPADTDGFDLSLLELNPPDHTRLRRVAAPAFTPRRLTAYATTIEKTMHRLVDGLPTAECPDLMRSVAAPLPIAVISELLGIPEADNDAFVEYGAALGGALDGISSLRHARRLLQAQHAVAAMFTRLLQERRADPADDLISILAAQEGDQIRPAEILPLCRLLLIAGFETTVTLIGNAVVQLHRHPDQWALLTADPALASGTVEEVLRFDPPVQLTSRVSLEDNEIGGHAIQRGQWVVTIIGGTGRDPQVWADPNRFDIRRPDAKEHLAFSPGIHYCLGAPLARLEAEIALRVIAERLPQLRVIGTPPMRRTRTIRGVRTLPVQLTAR